MRKITTVLMGAAMLLSLSANLFGGDCCHGAPCCKSGACCRLHKK